MESKTHNEMVDVSRYLLTPEQREEYKRMGEYMYNSTDYKTAVEGSKVRESKDEDLILYATEALKSGADPKDLTESEIQALCKVYGDKWYERFGFTAEDIPKTMTVDDVFKDAEDKAKKIKSKMTRRQRRVVERRMEKDRKTLQKKK